MSDSIPAAKRPRRPEDPEKNRARAKAWRIANPERARATTAAWSAANPERVRAIRQASAARNRETNLAAQRRWRENNPQAIRLGQQRRRARARSATVYLLSARDQQRLLAPCYACGATEDVTDDHRVPLSRGGTHGTGNLSPMCSTCNKSKNNLTFTEWKYSNRPRARLLFGDLTDSLRARNLARRT